MRRPHRVGLTAVCGLAVACGIVFAATASRGDSGDAVPRPEPEAKEIAEGWFQQRHGFDALEAYEADLGNLTIAFGLARKWQNGRVRLLIDFNRPQVMDELMLLLLQRRGRSDDLFVYLSPKIFPPLVSRRVRRLHVGRLDLGIPSASRFVQMSDLRPFLPEELRHERLPDIEIQGHPCRVIESRPTEDGRFPFDRVEFAISKVTGVALRTRHFKAGRLTREVNIDAGDVAEFDGRWLPIRERIEVPSGETVDLRLLNIDVDPPLPNRLFSRGNLIKQKFPAF